MKEESVSYMVDKKDTETPVSLQISDENHCIICIRNPHSRADKFLAEQLSISRSKIKRLITDGVLQGSNNENLEKIHITNGLIILLKTDV